MLQAGLDPEAQQTSSDQASLHLSSAFLCADLIHVGFFFSLSFFFKLKYH